MAVRTLVIFAFLWIPLAQSFAQKLPSAEIRYDDVVYLDEIHAKPLPLKTTQGVALTLSRDQSTIVAYLPKSQIVWVLGFGDGRDYVETVISTGKAKGWIDVEALEDAPADIREDIEKRVKTARHFKQLIAKHEIDQGMSKAQVQSALGKPEDRSRSQEGDKVEEQWVYRVYKSVPQRDVYYVDGKPYERIYYKKVLSGGKTVTFRNDQVIGIKDEDKTPEPGNTTIVTPPAVYGN